MHVRPKVIEETEVILESAASAATVEGLLGFIFSKVNSKKTGGSDEERRLLLSALLSTQTEQSKRLDLLDSMIRQHAAAEAEAPRLPPAELQSLVREAAATLALAGLGYSSIDAQHQEIFAVHAGQIWHRWWWQESGWSDWHQFRSLPDDALVASATAGHQAPGYQDVFAVSIDGRLFHTWYDAPAQTWADWEPMQGTITKNHATI